MAPSGGTIKSKAG